MDQRLGKLVQVVSGAMFSWFVLSTLGRLHWIFPFTLWLFAIGNVVLAWLLRRRFGLTKFIGRIPFAKRWLTFVSSCTGDPLPWDQLSSKSGVGQLLHSKRDFEQAKMRAKQAVRGHDAIIESMLEQIFQTVTLRTRRKKRHSERPLGAFLLVGREGIGKRYLSRVVAKLLYRGGDVNVFDCEQLNAKQLAGTKDAPSDLLRLLERHAHRMLVFENVDRAAPEVQCLLEKMVSSGKIKGTGTDKWIAIADTTVVLTTARCTDELEVLFGQRIHSSPAVEQQAVELLRDQASITPSLLSAMTDMCVCHPPDDLVKSEVVALLMRQECREYETQLSHVDPEIIATQVMRIDDEHGFALAPESVRKLLRKPLVAACSTQHESLALHVRKG